MIAEIEWFILYFGSKFNSPNFVNILLFYFLILFSFRIILRVFIKIINRILNTSFLLRTWDFVVITGLLAFFWIDQKTSINLISKSPTLISAAISILFAFVLFAFILIIKKLISNFPKRAFVIISIFILFLSFVILLKNSNTSKKTGTSKQILLVSIDSLRPDHLSFYGYKNIQTKTLDRLANGSFVFTNAYCQAPYTASSLASISTGCFPFNTNVRNFGMALNPKLKTIGESLSEHNYDCIMIGGPEYDFDNYIRGFRKIDLASLPYFEYIHFNISNIISKKPIKYRTACASSFIKNNRGKAYFIWIHYWDPHAPYQPPSAYMTNNLDSRIDGSVEQLLGFINDKSVSDEEIKDIVQLYDSEILFIDDNIEMLFKDFIHNNKNYLYVITADHGEAIGENDLFLHSHDLIEEMIKVPLIINCSWLDKPAKKISQIVSHIDIIPTILDCMKLGKSEYSYDGKSLLPLMRNEVQNYSEFSYFETQGVEKVGFRNKKYKFVYDVKTQNKEVWCFKNPSQPEKKISNSSISKELENKLLDLLNISRLEDIKIYERKILDEKLKERLKSLGYIH